MARSLPSLRPALLMLVYVAILDLVLLRVYAWKMLLADNGVFNNIAIALGLLDQPLKMMNTPFSLTLGMVYTYLPFMVLPLYANLVKMDCACWRLLVIWVLQRGRHFGVLRFHCPKVELLLVHYWYSSLAWVVCYP